MKPKLSHPAINKFFSSFKDALLACNSAGYHDFELVEWVVRKNILLKEYRSCDEPYKIENFRTVLAVLWALNERQINVLDFGGGAGNHYFLSKQLVGHKAKWAVVETSAMCKAAAALSDGHLRFFSSMSDAKLFLTNVDMVFASSSLQYVEDPILAIKSLMALSPKYIYITRTPFSQHSSIINSVQGSSLSDNGPGPAPVGLVNREIVYPITYVPLRSVLDLIRGRYKILFTMKEEAPTLFVNDVPINEYFGIFCELIAEEKNDKIKYGE